MSNVLAKQFSTNCEQLVLNFEGFNWTEIEGILYLSSKDLSIKTGKQHFNILKDIRKYIYEIDTEFYNEDDIIPPRMTDPKFGAIPVMESDVKEIARENYISHYLLNQTAALTLMTHYNKKLHLVICDFFLKANQHHIAQLEATAKTRFVEEQKAFKEARKTNAETIMIKLLDADKNQHYHRFVSVTKPVDYDAKLQGQYVRALMSAKSALEQLKDKGYEVPTIYRKRILRPSDITGWGEVDTRTRTFIDEEAVEHEVTETMEEISLRIPTFLNL